MANNRIVVKRTSTAGRTPNTTNIANLQYIAAGELALNMTDQTFFTSDGTNLIYVGSNVNTLYAATSANIASIVQANSLGVHVGANVVANTTTLKAGNTTFTTTNAIFGGTITTNGSIGTAGQVLTSGAGTNAYWSTASGGAKGGGSDAIFFENDQIVTTNYTITINKNAITGGPITINSGISVTIPTGSVWTIL